MCKSHVNIPDIYVLILADNMIRITKFYFKYILKLIRNLEFVNVLLLRFRNALESKRKMSS